MSNLSFNISTLNGTGSLTANQLLTRVLFRSGWQVGAYNFFPSNIAGLPCIYNLRINSQSHIGFTNPVDVLVTLNPKTLAEDLKDIKKDGLLISDKKSLLPSSLLEDFNGIHWQLPITQTVKEIPDLSFKQKAMFKNMVYLAFMCECLKVKESVLIECIQDVFAKKKTDKIIEQNLSVIQKVKAWAGSYEFPFVLPAQTLNTEVLQETTGDLKSESLQKVSTQEDLQKKEILIDGNTSSALGALFSGCQFVSWYPITPASSLAENFEKLAQMYQKDSKGKNKVLVLQSEDELAAISQVIGAGWTGVRAMTATSGPGLSLMAEGAGLSYFAEIPAVICHVQRAGPSTGLPTRTQQSDLLSACFLSHGDSKHVVLLPANPQEAFYFTAQAFDLAEQLQTLVIVLSDLDLGMNLRMSPIFNSSQTPLNRGKLLKEEDLKDRDFLPYKDENQDGVSYRTLPGVHHSKGAYLTRGSGHNQKAEYSEKAQDYSFKLDKLNRKWATAKKLVPSSIVEKQQNAKLAFITFGTNSAVIKELREYLLHKKILSNYLRVCAFPFSKEIESFLKAQDQIFVVEQNRDAQLKQLLSGEFSEQSFKMQSILQYDGRPFSFLNLKQQFEKLYSAT